MHELHELFIMIGDVSKCDCVLEFWNGVRLVIQKGLWRDNLNPETSSWDRVVAQAEIIKISENVVERRDLSKRSNQMVQGSPSIGNENQSRSSSQDFTLSSRSVSFSNQPQNQVKGRQLSSITNTSQSLRWQENRWNGTSQKHIL